MSIIKTGLLSSGAASTSLWSTHECAGLLQSDGTVTQTLNREQPWFSATEAQRLRDRQQLNKHFLQN